LQVLESLRYGVAGIVPILQTYGKRGLDSVEPPLGQGLQQRTVHPLVSPGESLEVVPQVVLLAADFDGNVAALPVRHGSALLYYDSSVCSALVSGPVPRRVMDISAGDSSDTEMDSEVTNTSPVNSV